MLTASLSPYRSFEFYLFSNYQCLQIIFPQYMTKQLQLPVANHFQQCANCLLYQKFTKQKRKVLQRCNVNHLLGMLHICIVNSLESNCLTTQFLSAIIKIMFVFTALHVMQTRYCDENSVCLSVTRVIPGKMEERSVQIFIPYERTFSLVF